MCCLKGFAECAEFLIKQVKADVHVPVTAESLRPLHLAVQSGSLPTVKVVVEVGRARVSIQTTKGYTPLHYACGARKHDIYTYLIQKGADPSIKDKVRINLLSALYNIFTCFFVDQFKSSKIIMKL
jgi:ankyrin repeat protein